MGQFLKTTYDRRRFCCLYSEQANCIWKAEWNANVREKIEEFNSQPTDKKGTWVWKGQGIGGIPTRQGDQ